MILCLLWLGPALAWSQEPHDAPWRQAQQRIFSPEARQGFYDQTKLSHTGALLRSAVLPGWGSIYADEAFKGVLWTTGFVAGAVTWFFGGVRRDDSAFFAVGGAVAASCYVGSLVSAYGDVSDYNERLRQRYKLAQVRLGWSWEF